MSEREHRRFTADQKPEILREANQPGVTVSEVCRRHSLSPSVLYRWRAVAQGGSAVALKRDAQRKPRKDDPETRHKAEIDRMRAVIAEITAENLELKKDLKLEDLSRVPAETIAAVMHLPHVVLRPIRIALALEAGVVTGGALDSQIPIRCALIDYDSHQDGARTLRLGPVGAARVVDIALGGLSVNMDDVFHGPEDKRWA